MKRLALMGASFAIFAGALVYGATGAFFSDTETSQANTFTAGAIDLKVDSEQHYNGMLCANVNGFGSAYVWIPESADAGNFTPADAEEFNDENPAQYPQAGTACSGSWVLKDLEPTLDKFFNFPDVKPGDEGENTVSLHIDNNDSWACVDITNIANDDNTLTEPEEGLLDSLPVGELAQNLNFIVWRDDGETDGWQGSEEDSTEGDNIWQQGEDLITSGPAPTTEQHYTLAAPPMAPLAGGTTGYVGVAWCAGTWSAIAPGATCDGSTMGNIAQTDSYSADVSFRIEQSRNNPNFTCTPPEEEPVITTLTLAKTVIPAEFVADASFTLIADGPTDISGIEGSGTVTNASVVPGTYNLSETGGPEGASAAWQCSIAMDDADTVTIAAGQNVVCTVTNTYNVQ